MTANDPKQFIELVKGKIMKNGIFILLAISVLALSGCGGMAAIEKASESKSHFKDSDAYKGNISYITDKEVKGEQYRIFNQAGSGFTGIDTIRQEAVQRANTFCRRKGPEYEMFTVSEQTSSPPYLLGNFPRIEIIFVCTKSKPNTKSRASGGSKYDQLTKIKELLDKGILTKEEYLKEKKKILSED